MKPSAPVMRVVDIVSNNICFCGYRVMLFIGGTMNSDWV